ncbi:uncharacterized protein LOC144180409 [Haemaphysalis longicornis]
MPSPSRLSNGPNCFDAPPELATKLPPITKDLIRVYSEHDAAPATGTCVWTCLFRRYLRLRDTASGAFLSSKSAGNLPHRLLISTSRIPYNVLKQDAAPIKK